MRFFGKKNELAQEIAVGGEPVPLDTEHANVEKSHHAPQTETTTQEKRGESTDEVNSLEKVPSADAQAGVRKAEAVTLTWTRKELYIAYACVFLVFFVVSMQQQIQFNLVYYVTSSFALLPLTGTTSIVSSIVGGVMKLPLAKAIDLIGRAEGFAFMVFLTTLGLIMMAACQNVETYAAAQVFYWVGFDGIAYVLDVFMADTSSLKNRALVFAFTTTPYIVTTFIGPRAAQSFLETSGWPWGYGTFAIVTPFITLPILYVLFSNQNKARKQGLLVKEKSGRTLTQNISFYFWEFDVIGILLICAGFVLFLLPFSLSTYQTNGYAAPMMIAFFVVGGVCLILFAVYEGYLAPKSFIPFELLTDRTVIGACLLSAFFFISFYLWDSYFYNYLQVVHSLSITNTGYVTNIYSIGSCFFAVITGLLIRLFNRFKYLCLSMLALQMLGVGLMIHFRKPDISIGYVVMCQIFIAFAGGAIVICEQMAVMAAAPHRDVASMLALIGLFSSVGGGIGQAISGAIYTHRFPAALAYALPGNSTLNAELYGSLTAQLSYAPGTPEREAVVYAYGETMWVLCVVSFVFLIPCGVFIGLWRDFKVNELRKVKGLVA